MSSLEYRIPMLSSLPFSKIAVKGLFLLLFPDPFSADQEIDSLVYTSAMKFTFEKTGLS